MALSYYSFDKLLSYNATFNMVLGPRGDGKTYGAKKKAIKDAIKKGKQFIYLRRYKDELSLASKTFFSDLEVNNEFPEYDFKVNGSAAYMAHIDTREDKKREWTLIGFFVALSRGQQYKSVNFARVHTIIFDEFVIEKGAVQYLPNEPIVLTNFYSTVDRYSNKTRLFMLANAVRITNPYFIYYDIDPDNADSAGFVKKGDGFMVIQFINDQQFVKDVLQTPFGKFIEGTQYADYAVSNEFSDNHKSLIGEKPSTAHYYFTIEASKGTFSIWFDRKTAAWYAQDDRPGNELIFTLEPETMDENKVLVTFNDKVLANLRGAYRKGRVKFNKASVRNAFVEIFNR